MKNKILNAILEISLTFLLMLVILSPYVDGLQKAIGPTLIVAIVTAIYSRNEKVVKVKSFKPECKLERHGDWIDLKAAETVSYGPGEFLMIPLGIAIELPKGYEAHILPRSSTYKRYHLLMTNSMGIVDNEYCGDSDQWYFPALATEEGTVQKGQRIAQFRIVKSMNNDCDLVTLKDVKTLDNKNRGGFGSSGV